MYWKTLPLLLKFIILGVINRTGQNGESCLITFILTFRCLPPTLHPTFVLSIVANSLNHPCCAFWNAFSLLLHIASISQIA